MTLRRTPIRRTSLRRDPVPATLAVQVFARDGGCVAPSLGGSEADCGGRLTLDHVKDQPRMGKRAPSDLAHLVTVCENHHLWNGWATSHRPELRAYLRDADPHAAHVDPCGSDCRRTTP